ncbi:hypothetical protein BDP27DRAFT_1374887 [Rhodocollybia butyracea]|uniref:Uncharacterized protein n=1 Tax=Rhodocollybia butyracea TaxID=206335 RepID=A0A9P5TWF1_9AGAR|nr:hypothetical protein BDP27DRAFT_1374887 [Rhodocollybia butyracea]
MGKPSQRTSVLLNSELSGDVGVIKSEKLPKNLKKGQSWASAFFKHPFSQKIRSGISAPDALSRFSRVGQKHMDGGPRWQRGPCVTSGTTSCVKDCKPSGALKGVKSGKAPLGGVRSAVRVTRTRVLGTPGTVGMLRVAKLEEEDECSGSVGGLWRFQEIKERLRLMRRKV